MKQYRKYRNYYSGIYQSPLYNVVIEENKLSGRCNVWINKKFRASYKNFNNASSSVYKLYGMQVPRHINDVWVIEITPDWDDIL